jgi:hypothetical protein
LKIEDIAQYEVVLVHKDSRVLDQNTEDLELALSPIDAISIENPIFANAELEQFRISETFLTSSEQYFASSKYADQQNEVLRNQLKEANLIPLEYIPLSELKQEIDRLIEKINNNQISDEETKRLDYLLICLEKNPEHIEEQQNQLQLWLVNSLPFIEESVVTMRGLIPPDIFYCSITTLRSQYHMSPALSKRIFDKKCLWLIRMAPNHISKLHEADLLNKYSYQAQNLDLTELTALYGCLPNEFINDGFGKKKKYKSDLLIEIRRMVILHSNNKLPPNKIRNPCYKQAIPLFAEKHELYSIFSEVEATSLQTEEVMTSGTGPLSPENAEAVTEIVAARGADPHESSLVRNLSEDCAQVESRLGEEYPMYLGKDNLLLPSGHVRRLTSIVSDLLASPSSPAGQADGEKKAGDEDR